MLLLDTNICIYLIKEKPLQVLSRLRTYNPDAIKISSIVLSELYFGAEKSTRKQVNLVAIARFIAPFEIIEFNHNDAQHFGKIRSELQSKGLIIGPYDMQIAAQALSRSWTVVTNNEKEFNRVTGLKVENWVKSSH